MSTSWLGAVLGVACVSVLSLGLPTHARGEQGDEDALRFSPGVHERFRYVRMAAFDLNDEGTSSGREALGEHRLRLSPRLTFGGLVAHVEVDVASGLLFGDTTTVGAPFLDRPRSGMPDARWIDPRQAYVEWTTPVGRLTVGQVASRWGLGLLANDGAGDAADLFSDPRHGDLVERVLFVTSPAALFTDAAWARKLFVGVGGDLVYRDDQADLREGDRAFQGVGSLFWRDEGLFAGVYVAYRHQEDDAGTGLRVTAVDGFASWAPGRFGALAPTFALEAALLVGRTSRAYSEWTGEDLDVLALGLVGRFDLDTPDLGLLTRVELGYASGDRNSADGTSRAFSMDFDHHAGMILFEEVLAWTSAAGADRAADPARLAVPRKGLDQLPTEGAVSNAFYLYPMLRYRPPTGPVKGLDAALGALLAFSPAGAGDPLASARRGGYPTNAFGGVADAWGFLGTEVDGRLGYTLAWLGDSLSAGLVVQGGVFLPGAALEGPAGSPGTVWKVRTGVDLRWM